MIPTSHPGRPKGGSFGEPVDVWISQRLHLCMHRRSRRRTKIMQDLPVLQKSRGNAV